MFVKEQFYLTKKTLTEIDNQSKAQQHKEFIELFQQQNKNLVEENKLKTTIIQMLVENQNNLNRTQHEYLTVTRKSSRKLSPHKTDEIKCCNRYKTL